MMVLIAGGTGLLGRQLSTRLIERQMRVRVLSRDCAKARAALPLEVEIVQGDVRDPASLDRACSGVDVVVSAVHGFTGSGGVSPRSVDRDGNIHLIDAAQRSGADFVLMSVVGASAEHPMELFRMKFAAEQYLRSSGMGWTIVRATAFLELWTTMLQQRPLIFGRGDNPINFVSVDDVAEAVERAVLDPSQRGQIIEVGGPENLTFNQLAQRLGTSPRHVPRAVLRLMSALLKPVAPTFARMAHAGLVMDTGDFTWQELAVPVDGIH